MKKQVQTSKMAKKTKTVEKKKRLKLVKECNNSRKVQKKNLNGRIGKLKNKQWANSEEWSKNERLIRSAESKSQPKSKRRRWHHKKWSEVLSKARLVHLIDLTMVQPSGLRKRWRRWKRTNENQVKTICIVKTTKKRNRQWKRWISEFVIYS